MTPAIDNDRNVLVLADGECTTRPSCCPGAGPDVTDAQCDQLCTTGMDPLEHTTASIGPTVWTDIIRQVRPTRPPRQSRPPPPPPPPGCPRAAADHSPTVCRVQPEQQGVLQVCGAAQL